MPPRAPAAPPTPTIEAISLLAKISDAKVKTLADQPWWAEVQSEIRPSAHQGLGENTARMTAGIKKAQTAIAVLRARFTGQPRFKRKPENHPPATLPGTAARKGTIPKISSRAIENCRTSIKYLGSQKM